MTNVVPSLISGLILQTLEHEDCPSRAEFARKTGLPLQRLNQLIDDYAEPSYPHECQKLAAGINYYCHSKFTAHSLKSIWDTQQDVSDYEEDIAVWAEEKKGEKVERTLLPC